MGDFIRLGRGRQILETPREEWGLHLAQVPPHSGDRLRFMTEEHHQVRYFVVRELSIRQVPIGPKDIAAALQIPLSQVVTILDELERKLFFLVRNQQGAVEWAYPVTVEPTPHRLSFSGGERLYAA